ncbi:putative rhodanese-related sulfurtransferase [Synechococcus sp. MIT S9509]|uniref:oxygen-dependent tRNA uridine(34) hydroxylase TrhO n=1 Tax=unclassified Synechococcus TaxID=2626047 RepID=UPI0007BBFCD0|nr:rhodanese-related sulfurtransferase [Synechococcus sp. MIT S9509]KZR86753.1 putative rhodanese-related sulfurtransferase [Synechococcus sp. MIT S9509]KZR87595.1 putative rhodanese-related sulfurtransferase [Synechococcus sp. MIT S9504]
MTSTPPRQKTVSEDSVVSRVSGDYLVAAFYAFTSLAPDELGSLLTDLPELASREQVVGSVLLASEGVNGTISGPDRGVTMILECLRSKITLGDAHFERLQVKRSRCSRQVFRRFKARRKREIVSLGQPCADPRRNVGTYVDPHHWNELVDDPDTLVIDTRNRYEVAVGSFVGSLDPETETFRGFPDWVEQHLRPLVERISPARIAMFCTGGIRCEKASSFLQQRGFPEVHHLKGGILNYLDQVPEEQSRWEGECFVFDQRVALNHQLEPGEHSLCHACGLPLTPKQRQLESYIPGVQCLQCRDRFTDGDRARFAMRQSQLQQGHLNQSSGWPSSPDQHG